MNFLGGIGSLKKVALCPIAIRNDPPFLIGIPHSSPEYAIHHRGYARYDVRRNETDRGYEAIGIGA
jgi:hypothetical protein